MGGANINSEQNVASDAFDFTGERAPVPRAPQMESVPAQIAAGVYNGAVAPTMDFMASPLGLATSAVPFAGQAASRVASAAFAPVAFGGMEEARQRANEVAKDPNATLQQKVEPIVEAASQGLMGIGASKHAIPAPELGKLGITPKNRTAQSMDEIDRGLEEAAKPLPQKFPTSEQGGTEIYSRKDIQLKQKGDGWSFNTADGIVSGRIPGKYTQEQAMNFALQMAQSSKSPAAKPTGPKSQYTSPHYEETDGYEVVPDASNMSGEKPLSSKGFRQATPEESAALDEASFNGQPEKGGDKLPENVFYHGGTYEGGSKLERPLYMSKNKDLANSYVTISQDRTGEGTLNKIQVDLKNAAPLHEIIKEADKIGIDHKYYTPASIFDIDLHGYEPVQNLINHLTKKGYDHAILTDIAAAGVGPEITDQAVVAFPHTKPQKYQKKSETQKSMQAIGESLK
jgi:hypothetical protein